MAGCKEREPDVETPPVIIVTGQNPLKTGIYLSFMDDSVRISGRFGIDSVWTEHNIDTSLLGYYQITYHAVSFSGMTVEAQRDVWVVVKPKSMKGLWDVSAYFPKQNLTMTFVDSLDVENEKIIINNLNTIIKEQIELSLAADLQDSVYIFDQYISDSAFAVFGYGTIDETAMRMELHFSLVENNDTTVYRAVYSRDSISIK